MNYKVFRTDSIDYEYTIISQLYEKKTIYKKLLTEVKKVINNQIDLVYNYYTYDAVDGLSLTEKEKLKKITESLFKNIAFEAGQIGSKIMVYDYTQGKNVKSFTEIKTLQDIHDLVKKFNIRESMTIIKNFHRGENHCLMYKIILLYKKVNSLIEMRNFERNYPMININTLNESITFIENILGINILVTDNHFQKLDPSDALKSKDKNQFELISKATRQTEPLYEYLEKDTQYRNPVNLCYLWHPLSVQIPYQAVTKMMINNVLKDLILSYKPISLMKLNKKQKEGLEMCMQDKLDRYPPIPALSKNEINFLYYTSSKEKNIDTKEYGYVDSLNFLKKIGWTPAICYHEEIVPQSFILQQLKREKRLSISNYSGHTTLLIMIASYFNNINFELLLLANMLWTVPYNHSLHEVFMGGMMVDVFSEYRLDLDAFDNVNNLLMKNDLPELDNTITWNGEIYKYKEPETDSAKRGGRKTKKTIYWRDMKPSDKTLKKYKKKFGKKCFLLPEQNKYPICDKNTGKKNCKGLLAAYYRSMLSVYRKLKPKSYSYKRIANKAKKTAKTLKCNWAKKKN